MDQRVIFLVLRGSEKCISLYLLLSQWKMCFWVNVHHMVNVEFVFSGLATLSNLLHSPELFFRVWCPQAWYKYNVNSLIETGLHSDKVVKNCSVPLKSTSSPWGKRSVSPNKKCTGNYGNLIWTTHSTLPALSSSLLLCPVQCHWPQIVRQEVASWGALT